MMQKVLSLVCIETKMKKETNQGQFLERKIRKQVKGIYIHNKGS